VARTALLNMTYTCSAGKSNGQIASTTDAVPTPSNTLLTTRDLPAFTGNSG
jgi:hypothetical protein